MGLWAWSPEHHDDMTAKSMNTTSLVQLKVDESIQWGKEYRVCQAKYLNGTDNNGIEFCFWEVQDAQLRISLPDEWATTEHINSKFGTLATHD